MSPHHVENIHAELRVIHPMTYMNDITLFLLPLSQDKLRQTQKLEFSSLQKKTNKKKQKKTEGLVLHIFTSFLKKCSSAKTK